MAPMSDPPPGPTRRDLLRTGGLGLGAAALGPLM